MEYDRVADNLALSLLVVRNREFDSWQERTKDRISQCKGARAGLLAVVDKPQVARTVSSGRFLVLPMPWCLSLALRFFILLYFRIFAFIESTSFVQSLFGMRHAEPTTAS